MNKLHFILMLLCASLLLTGCDTIRSMLGKPTSADIEQMRIEQLAAEKAARDSVAAAQRTAEEAPVLQQPESDLKYRYYVVLGSFKTSGFADALCTKLAAEKVDSQVVKFSTGYEAVFAGGDNDYNVVLKRMREYMECNFCPYDVWIYDTEIYKIHE